MACRFGDEKSSKEIPCQVNSTSDTIPCMQPRRRQVPFRDLPSASREETVKAGRASCFPDIMRQQLFRATLAAVLGEFIGTCLLTLVICTSVAVSVIVGAHVGLWQVAIVGGLGVAMSIYFTAYFSDAHLNPAVTLAFAIVRFRSFHWWKVFPYMVAQLLGGILAGALLLGTYGLAVVSFEAENNITRGEPGSQLSAMIFGEYFPNPAVYSHDRPGSLSIVPPTVALFVEAWCTTILVFTIFALTDKHNTSVGRDHVLFPLLIGLTVAMLVSIYAPLTQAGFNPARDFGPRLVSAIAGWGSMAIPGPRSGFWVYILGPFLGGPIGGAVYDLVVANVAKFARTEFRPLYHRPQQQTLRANDEQPSSPETVALLQESQV